MTQQVVASRTTQRRAIPTMHRHWATRGPCDGGRHRTDAPYALASLPDVRRLSRRVSRLGGAGGSRRDRLHCGDEQVDAICSLCPPATAHVVASEIARRTGLPWVAQFDDLYSFHLERQRRAAWRPYADRRHRRVDAPRDARRRDHAGHARVRRAHVWTRRRRRRGRVSTPRRVHAFEHAQPHDRLRLAYTGSVYPGDQRPDMLFDGTGSRDPRGGASNVPLELIFAGTGRDDGARGEPRVVSCRSARVSFRGPSAAAGRTSTPTRSRCAGAPQLHQPVAG